MDLLRRSPWLLFAVYGRIEIGSSGGLRCDRFRLRLRARVGVCNSAWESFRQSWLGAAEWLRREAAVTAVAKTYIRARVDRRSLPPSIRRLHEPHLFPTSPMHRQYERRGDLLRSTESGTHPHRSTVLCVTSLDRPLVPTGRVITDFRAMPHYPSTLDICI